VERLSAHNSRMIIDCAVYEAGQRRPGTVALDQVLELGQKPGSFVWIGLYEPSPEEFDTVVREFGLHELAVEDAIKAHQRPKLEIYGDSLFMVLKTARYLDAEEKVEFGEIMVFVGANFVVTVRHTPASALGDVRKQIESRPDLLQYGPGAALYAILDRVVDDYVPVINGVDTDIKEVEKQVFSSSGSNPAERIYLLKREVVEFHQVTAPLVDPLDRLIRRRYPAVDAEFGEYFRDVEDHLLRVVDRVEGFRDLLTSVLDANLAQVAVRQNEDMRRISAWVAMAAVPTLIAGIYGMNFLHMPELRWRLGYPLALAVMAIVCAALYRSFRRNGWL
jgi:magnesium transporter